jgi:dihydroflavonol-4-reductase
MIKTIFITGISGYIAKACAASLIKKGYAVKGSLRDLKKGEQVKADIEVFLGQSVTIDFVELDLCKDDGWADAMTGCDALFHMASPFKLKLPKDEALTIKPAKEGTIRALKSANNAGIERVILTSSNAASYFGNEDVFEINESVWSNINHPLIDTYTKSKTVAEKAAWDFVAENNHIKLTTINPTLVWGPGVGKNPQSTSLDLFAQLMNKKMPFVPRMKLPVVDIRDVVSMHIAALEAEDSFGKRFLLSEGEYWMVDVCQFFNEQGLKIPVKAAPNGLLRFLSLFDRSLKSVLYFLDRDYSINTSNARNVLGFKPIPINKIILDTYHYLN